MTTSSYQAGSPAPYPGLRPFRQEETDIFFGRETHTDQLIDQLGKTHFLAVVGPSGCGKSSLVYTGMLAGLEMGFLSTTGFHWKKISCRPGNAPFKHLTEALLSDPLLGQTYKRPEVSESASLGLMMAELRRGPHSLKELLSDISFPSNCNLLIVIDQFEEIFRYHKQGAIDESIAFISLLLKSSQHSNIYVVITMRSDFLGDCALFLGLPEAIHRSLFLTPRLTRDQLEQAIVGPARVFNWEIEPALVNRLLNDIGSDPDQLPLLQHALMYLWTLANQQPSPVPKLTLADYERIGGLNQALSKHADQAFEELNDKQKRIAEILFCALTERSSDRRDTRRLVKLAEVAQLAKTDWEQVAEIVEVFRRKGREFITPTSTIPLTPDTILDICHESFIRQWNRLEDWVEKESESADIYRRLEDSTLRWERKEAELWSGIELDIALHWYQQTSPTVVWAKRYGKQDGQYFKQAIAFLKNSEVNRRRKVQQAKREQQRQTLLALFGFFITTWLAVWAIKERDNALESEQMARNYQHRAELSKQKAEWTEKLKTIDLFESQLIHASLLAHSENYSAANKILKASHKLDSSILETRQQARNALNWYNRLMGGNSFQTELTEVPLRALALSPDKQYLAVAGERGMLYLIDTKDGGTMQSLQGHDGHVKTVAFDPQKRWLASGADDEKILFWSVPTAQQPTSQLLNTWETGHPIQALTISPDGKTLAYGHDNSITIKPLESTESPVTFTAHQDLISALAYDASGNRLASASYDDTAKLWQIDTGQLLQTLTGHTGDVHAICFNPENTLLATASSDNTVRLWDVNTGENTQILSGHTNTVAALTFINQGKYIVSGSKDRTLRIWEPSSGVTLRVLQDHSAGITAIAGSQAPGEPLFSASEDHSVMHWDTRLPNQYLFDLPSEPASVAIAPQGQFLALGFSNGSLGLYRYPVIQPLWTEPTAHNKDIQKITFNSQGNLLVSASLDGTATLWQVRSETDNEQLSLHKQQKIVYSDPINAAAFSPDGEKLALATNNGHVGIVTLATGNVEFFQATGGEMVSSVQFNSQGTTLLSTGKHDVRLWDMQNKTPQILEEYPETSSILTWSALSPNDREISSVGLGQKIQVYNADNKYPVYLLEGHESTIVRANYTPNGKQLVTASADATVRMWDLEKGNELFKLKLPAKVQDPIPLWDFDYRCIEANCWLAIPLISNNTLISRRSLPIAQLLIYQLDNSYREQTIEQPTSSLTEEPSQFIPMPLYRTGVYGASGTAIFGGFIDYLKLLNQRDGGINGIKLTWEECETAYRVDRAMECYEKLKHKGVTGASVFNFLNTGATYLAMEQTEKDKIPIVSIGYGRSDAADGRVFSYLFPLATTYWNQNTTKIKFIGQKIGGMDKLKGKIIADVYHQSEYGRETIAVLDEQAKRYGFIIKYFPVSHPGTEQTETWDQIKRLNPEWIILRGWGAMTAVALKEAQRIGFPTDHIIGSWWTGSEEEVKPAKDAAVGFITAGFHPSGIDFPVIQAILNTLYATGQGTTDKSIVGSINYNRGIIHGILNTEAIRTAQAKFGNEPLTGEQIQWGLEHLNLTEKRIESLGATGLVSTLKTSCTDHEGQGKVKFQQWDGKQWNIISNWITPNYNLTQPLVEASAKQYAQDNGIVPRLCDNQGN